MGSLKEQTLNIEQMKKLKSLGVDTTNASAVLIFKDDEGNEVEWDDVEFIDGKPFYLDYDDNKDELFAEYMDAETGNYDHSYRDICGVFTFEDVMRFLPKFIEVGPNFRKYDLEINFRRNFMAYRNPNGATIYRSSLEAGMAKAAYLTLYAYLNDPENK